MARIAEAEQRFWELSTEVERLRRENAELQRVNTDLEEQIHEEDGFIDRIVRLEDENAELRDLLSGAIRLTMEGIDDV